MDTMEGLHRSQYCAEVSEADKDKEVVLCGWVERRRDHGGLIFIDLRDRTGIVQVVASPDYEKESFEKAEQVRTEYVLVVRGIVRMRDADTVNDKMKTGTIEVRCEELRILNSSKTPPFYIEDNIDVDEKIRLKYRYLDLRRPIYRQLAAYGHMGREDLGVTWERTDRVDQLKAALNLR